MTNPSQGFNFQIKLFNALADAVLLTDDTGHVIQANSLACTLLGYTEKEICGLEVEAFMLPQYRNHHRHHRAAFYTKPEKRFMNSDKNLVALRQDGVELAVRIHLSPIKIEGLNYILVTFYCDSQHQQMESALQLSQEQLQLSKKIANLGVFNIDLDHHIVHWDARMRELWGAGASESTSLEKFIEAIHPSDRDARQAIIDFVTKAASDGEYALEYRIINTIDKMEYWIASVGKVYFKDDHAVNLVGVVRDITEQKKIETKLQMQRAETENLVKQQVASYTAAAIAHELNQPLSAISTYSEVALHALQTNTFNHNELKQALSGCISQTQRAGKSLHDLLAFLQKDELLTERLNVNEIVQEALEVVQSNGYGKFKLIFQLEKNIPEVLMNRVSLQKVIVNLLKNSVEAMQITGTPNSAIIIKVRTSAEKNMVHITVHDNGPGISPEVASHLFKPFYTTKPNGIGMGLAICRALIQSNGGQLWVDSNAEHGAMFHFTLPLAL